MQNMILRLFHLRDQSRFVVYEISSDFLVSIKCFLSAKRALVIKNLYRYRKVIQRIF